MGTTWVYIRSEPGLFTVGFYDPKGEWHCDSDYDSREEAAKRVHYLNGGGRVEMKNCFHLESNVQICNFDGQPCDRESCNELGFTESDKTVGHAEPELNFTPKELAEIDEILARDALEEARHDAAEVKKEQEEELERYYANAKKVKSPKVCWDETLCDNGVLEEQPCKLDCPFLPPKKEYHEGL